MANIWPHADGNAFAYEDSGYYGYGDLNTNQSWIYLSEGLDVGTEFTIQLVPVLAADGSSPQTVEISPNP